MDRSRSLIFGVAGDGFVYTVSGGGACGAALIQPGQDSGFPFPERREPFARVRIPEAAPQIAPCNHSEQWSAGREAGAHWNLRSL